VAFKIFTGYPLKRNKYAHYNELKKIMLVFISKPDASVLWTLEPKDAARIKAKKLEDADMLARHNFEGANR